MTVITRKIRYQIALVPSIIFWVASIAFFVIGLSFGDTTGWMLYISFGLAIANTALQIIGNDSTIEEIGVVIFVGWIAGYVLGISSNVNALLTILNIDNKYLEWGVCGSLGVMIEVLPERLWVLFWKTTFPYGISPPWLLRKKKNNHGDNKHKRDNHNDNRREINRELQSMQVNTRVKRPSGMPRAEWQKMLSEIYREPQSVEIPDEVEESE